VLVGAAYVGGLLGAAMAAAILGAEMPASTASQVSFAALIVASVLLGLVLGPIASRLTLRRSQHLLLWASLIAFNMGAVAIEGAYFAPELVPIPIPVLLAQQAAAAMAAALVITWAFGHVGTTGPSWSAALRTRRLPSWLGRFALASLCYLALYFVFGALNYSLVTRPYYESHAGGLTAPEPGVVLAAELVRAPLIVLSVLLFLLSSRDSRRRLMLTTGWLLFAVGGLVPLVLQVGSLPFFLLAASAIEIFFQNFLTGAAAARLMGVEEGLPMRTGSR
jgi:hypothetical protein